MEKRVEQIVLMGASGHGKDVLDAAKMQGRHVIGFTDENHDLHGTLINGVPVLGGDEWLLDHRDVQVLFSVENPPIKRKLAEFIESHNLTIASPIIHPRAFVSNEAYIGHGTVILGGSIIQPQVRVGHHVYISTVSTLGHDVIVGDFASLHPGVQIAGDVVIERGSYIGMGAKILQGLKIGEGAVVGAGAVVTKNVEPGTTVVGIPARPMF